MLFSSQPVSSFLKATSLVYYSLWHCVMVSGSCVQWAAKSSVLSTECGSLEGEECREIERELEMSKAVRRRQEFRSNLAGHRVYLQAVAAAGVAAIS
jgi:hypothetical protein